MKHYVIQYIARWTNKDGSQHESVMYFKQHTTYIVPMNSMSDLAEAKRYEYISDARRDLKKYFGNRPHHKIVAIKN